jgi:hypothetical protein
VSASAVVSLPIPIPIKGTVHLGKPWYLSKKMWVGLVSAVGVVVSAYFGKADTTTALLDKIQRTAGLVLIAAPLIMSITKVDVKERDFVLGLLTMAKTIETPDAPDAGTVAVPDVVVPNPDGSTATAAKPIPGLHRTS